MHCRGFFILPSRHPVYAHEFGHALGYDSHDMGVIDTVTKYRECYTEISALFRITHLL